MHNELCNHFVEGHPSSIKFTVDLSSHVLHGLLGTMFTVSVVNILKYTEILHIEIYIQ